MQPFAARRQLIGFGREARRDEPGREGARQHGANIGQRRQSASPTGSESPAGLSRKFPPGHTGTALRSFAPCTQRKIDCADRKRSNEYSDHSYSGEDNKKGNEIMKTPALLVEVDTPLSGPSGHDRLPGSLGRDSPDESQTGINVRVFPAFLQDRREVLTATSTSGNSNAWSRV